MDIKDLNNNKINENSEEEKGQSKCWLICIIIILVMMLPASLALLAIF